MQKGRVNIQKMPDFTRRRASSAEAQVERMPTTLALLQASPHPLLYLLLPTSRATELCLATTLTWSDEMRW